MAALRDFLDAAQPRDVVATILLRVAPPSIFECRELVSLLNTHPGVKNVSHHAFITDSAAIFSINTLVKIMSRKPWLERTFTSPANGLAWLSHVSPRFDAALLREDIARTVPERFAQPHLLAAR